MIDNCTQKSYLEPLKHIDFGMIGISNVTMSLAS